VQTIDPSNIFVIFPVLITGDPDDFAAASFRASHDLIFPVFETFRQTQNNKGTEFPESNQSFTKHFIYILPVFFILH
jgi:hypothetical protein